MANRAQAEAPHANTGPLRILLETLKASGPDPQGRLVLAHALLSSVDEAVLATRPTAELTTLVDHAMAFLQEKPVGAPKVAVRSLGGDRAVIEILNQDMPFLVDSIAAELHTRGLAIDLVLHPLIKCERTPDGRLVRILGSGDKSWNDTRQESYIATYVSGLAAGEDDAIVAALKDILKEVRTAVGDWQAMLARLGKAIADLEAAPASVPAAMRQEAIAFLKWLEAGNITLLGMREYRLDGDMQTGTLAATEEAGLGLLQDPKVLVLRRGSEFVALTPEIRDFYLQPDPLIITKANVRSRVHRRAYMDYIGVKTYRADGSLAGELRIVGLFTSQAYVKSPREIPILRQKVETVIARSSFPPESHDGKALLNVLESFPRDELFQIGVDDLATWTAGILDLELRPRVRVFARTDRFDRFVSALVFVPRDRFSTRVREEIGNYLAAIFHGHVSAFTPYFTEGQLTRVHFIIGRREGTTPKVAAEVLEQGVATIVKTWQDRLVEALHKAGPKTAALAGKYREAFSAGYAEFFPTARAIEDIRRIERLGPDRPLAIDFYLEKASGTERLRAAVYRFDEPIRLSERVPVLENLGFSVIDERTYEVAPRFGDMIRKVVLHDMVLEAIDGSTIDIRRHDVRLEDAFRAVLGGATSSDTFNRLIIAAGADWREAALMRSYAAYMRQLGLPFGPAYIAATLIRHAGIARDLVELFHHRFNPDHGGSPDERIKSEAPIRERIAGALSTVESLDEDRIINHLLSLIDATVRTNFHQKDTKGQPPEIIAVKLAGHEIEFMPRPRTYREIWVASPRVEGVHLRFAPIARGGIRWSDRAQDFRTEVLGLVKAQQVKNAVIVPAGSKGGFIPKLLPRGGSRETIQAEGTAAYRIFISAMLDLTDNLVDGKIVPPERVVRYDGDDPYLVVAADKGTATFSDLANEISTSRDFWLGDAFASGGSAGYDHKKMGITARGAWECVKRHFREMDTDIQTQPFTVIGVGDMSGDVFGNGMLLSPAIRLHAAFDHRDIFLDPDPDAAVSLAERARLFALPRSSWQDYNKSLISKGGGVFPRSSKSVPLSPEVRAMLGIKAEHLTPADLLNAILKTETDLLWFGGIGTYIRASTETDADAGDRANDAIRVTAPQIRAKVIGEGANLGVTQRARMELSARGVRLNTDFIDNSAGVNSSDQEVNIKIAVVPVVKSGRLDIQARNTLLASMTDEVAEAVLRNNYQQSLALSLAERNTAADLSAHARLIEALEHRGILEREIEFLPSLPEISVRQSSGRGLTRPELAVLLSYAKIALRSDLLASAVPDAPALEPRLIEYFPPELARAYPDDLRRHQLRREIIATTVTNAVVNRLGAAAPQRMADETARPVAEIAYAFTVARAVLGLNAIWPRIDALDNRIGGTLQLDLYARTQEALAHTTRWFLRDGQSASDLEGTMATHTQGAAELTALIARGLGEEVEAQLRTAEQTFVENQVPVDLAADLARLALLVDAPAITEAASRASVPYANAARVVLGLNKRFHLRNLIDAGRRIRASDAYDMMAVAGAEQALLEARRRIALGILATPGEDALARWAKQHGEEIARVAAALDDLSSSGPLTPARLMVAATRLGDLSRTTA
ncbi:MAG: NAD-glutamate dehydrogenase [Hyphomicrobium sp.]|nr:NAD-glutamate dehydrogenase [Hyphomicrobium sp.]